MKNFYTIIIVITMLLIAQYSFPQQAGEPVKTFPKPDKLTDAF